MSRSISPRFIIFSVLFVSQGSAQDFGYNGDKGPNHWGEKFETCVGKHQSPIDISEHKVNTVRLKPIVFSNFHNIPDSATLSNNGHTVMVNMKSDKLPEIVGGPLKDTYRFAQFHFHWGENDNEGSENTINNNSFPMELHIVFYKTIYGGMLEAVNHPDGLTVLAFLYMISDTDNAQYNVILNVFPDVENPNSTAEIKNILTLESLLIPDRKQYFTYDGSLTTPPCSEVVTWIEFKNPIPLSHEQLQEFRKLNNEEGKMTHNFRPTQPLYGRLIFFNNGDEVLENELDMDKENKNTNKNKQTHKKSHSVKIGKVNLLIILINAYFIRYICLY